jgi:anthranilate phosphoribosyltransferase
MLRDLLSGTANSPAADMLCLNAAAALLANETVASLVDGVKLARETLLTGKARHKLADVVACSRSLVR